MTWTWLTLKVKNRDAPITIPDPQVSAYIEYWYHQLNYLTGVMYWQYVLVKVVSCVTSKPEWIALTGWITSHLNGFRDTKNDCALCYGLSLYA